jgi:uncharacterized membrane-anchored protein YhcB (DUF1043 family)
MRWYERQIERRVTHNFYVALVVGLFAGALLMRLWMNG